MFAEGQAAVVAERHRRAGARRGRRRPSTAAAGICYLEFGDDEVAKVDVTFLSGQPPVGDFEGPSVAFARDKAEFGTTRIQRWFGRTWHPVGDVPG